MIDRFPHVILSHQGCDLFIIFITVTISGLLDVYVCFACMCLCTMCVWCPQKTALDPLELEFQTISGF